MPNSSCSEKKCPFKFDNFNIQNILLIILTLKTIWNCINKQQPEINLEEIVLNKLNPNLGMGFPPTILTTPKTPVVCSSFSISKLIFLGFFIYLIFFIRDLLQDLSCSNEVSDEKMCNKCPFRLI
jgi:hypothetical protein